MLHSRFSTCPRVVMGTLAAALVAAGCSSHDSGNMAATGGQSVLPAARSLSRDLSPNISLLKNLNQVVIGSAIDPVNGAQNPYGLTVAPITSGLLTAGDLVICNFNSKFNTQGSGRSIVGLHPTPGSSPFRIAGNSVLLGCSSLALSPDDTIWATAFAANDYPIISSSGMRLLSINGRPFSQPWGQVFAAPTSGPPAFYESNAATGTIVRVNLGSSFTFDVIGSRFPRNRGVAGTALAPSGLAYDPSIDTLYFADGQNNTVVAFKNVSTIPNGGIVATNDGMTFTGPSAADARVVFSGPPLNGPISTALLPNGNLVVGNTLDPSGQNLLIELSPAGKVLAIRNVDKGAGGAIFGIVATGTSNSDTKIYFNDDNANNVQVLQH